MTDQVEELEALLDSCPPPRKLPKMETNPELVKAVRWFLDLKAKDDPRARMSLRWFYSKKLRDRYEGPKTESTVIDYVRTVMRLDPDTGKPLDQAP